MSFSTGIVGEGKEMRGEVPSSVVCESEGEERKATSSLIGGHLRGSPLRHHHICIAKISTSNQAKFLIPLVKRF